MWHNLGQTSVSTVDVGALGFPQLSSSPKNPPPSCTPFPCYRPHIPRSLSRGHGRGAYSGQLPVECRKQFDMGIRQHGGDHEWTSRSPLSCSQGISSALRFASCFTSAVFVLESLTRWQEKEMCSVDNKQNTVTISRVQKEDASHLSHTVLASPPHNFHPCLDSCNM